MSQTKPKGVNYEDIEIVPNSYPYSTNFLLFKTDKEVDLSSAKYLEDVRNSLPKGLMTTLRKDSPCFAYLLHVFQKASYGSLIDEYKAHNKIAYYCKRDDLQAHGVNTLTDDEVRAWIKLCVENKLLDEIPDYFFKHYIVCLDLEKYCLPRLYIQLCALRYIQESPYFVRAMLKLVNDGGVGFFTAIMLATKVGIMNNGHHIIPEGYFSKSLEDGFGNMDFLQSACLYHLVNSEEKSSPEWYIPKRGEFYGLKIAFGLIKEELLKKYKDKSYQFNIEYMYVPEIEEAIRRPL